MTTPNADWNDDRVQHLLGRLLRAGVLIAGAVVLVGGIVFLAQYGSTLPDYRVFHGEPRILRRVPAIVRDALTLDGRGIIQFGLLLLVATPIARVVFSVIAFALERDYLYVMLTLFVLGILVYSFLGGYR